MSVILFYGTIGDDPTTFRKDSVPLYDRPYLTLTEWTSGSPQIPGVAGYSPPSGSLFIATGGRTGVVQRDGVHVAIQASNAHRVLEAAEALSPMSR